MPPNTTAAQPGDMQTVIYRGWMAGTRGVQTFYHDTLIEKKNKDKIKMNLNKTQISGF